MTGNISYI